ncbi:hypothetical protein MUU74_06875 [Chryseobacterium daecheongense]|uniref:hypothetical protein n=1 Tax=Chryseobacterium daecheongense TaxID=192389 RepID=UPI001FD678D5|nr:hypothetical protein [Chryseobacterium daecheongense]UOU99671.1 hypothetical protein MUU74_06875 [Chryseobacterium daecheongense]
MKNLLSFFILPVFVLGNLLPFNYLRGSRGIRIEKQLEKDNQIVYLFFKVEKDNSGMEKITFQGKKMSPGKLKLEPTFDRGSAGIGDYIISLNDSGGKEIGKQLVKNPLNPEMEIYEDGISRNKVVLQDAEFSIRYSHGNVTMVKIEKLTKEGTQLLFTQKL